jgi:hypothetical protein
MKNILNSVPLFILLWCFSGCNDDYLDRFPETMIGKENFFKSEEDLNLYILNLYNFPSTGIYTSDAATDNAATTGNTELKTMMVSNPSSATITGGWSWEQLRNINFFLENFRNANISQEKLDHYEGLARYFRARFYVEKIKRYSDVPWIDKVVTTDDDVLFGSRDPRETVVRNIMEDFAFAAAHVNPVSSKGAVNQWVVKMEFARFALYEGTFRKYHLELGLENTGNEFLQSAVDLAKDIMDNGGFAIYNTGNPMEDYGRLFSSEDLNGNPEMIMVRYYEDDVLNGDSGYEMFGNYEYNPVKDLVQTYLMRDGSFYSSNPGYGTYEFIKEFQDRDPRLYQSYAFPGWELVYTGTYSQGGGVYVQQLAKNFSGYHQIKGFYNTTDQAVRNNMDVPLYRFAEVLLIFAEAKAEMGNLTQDDLDISINELRRRVGMPAMTVIPAIDPVQENRYPNVHGEQKNLILEIRRERRVELAFEGFRYDDLMRWNAGKLLEKEPQGIYFGGLGKFDMNGDGEPDIYLIPASSSIPEQKETNNLGEPLRYYRAGVFGQDVSVFLANGDSGNIQITEDSGDFIEPKYYYRPIPHNEITLNPNLTQIFGWE